MYESVNVSSVGVCVRVCVHVRVPEEGRECVRSPVGVVAGSCELHVGPENCTWVFVRAASILHSRAIAPAPYFVFMASAIFKGLTFTFLYIIFSLFY